MALGPPWPMLLKLSLKAEELVDFFTPQASLSTGCALSQYQPFKRGEETTSFVWTFKATMSSSFPQNPLEGMWSPPRRGVPCHSLKIRAALCS